MAADETITISPGDDEATVRDEPSVPSMNPDGMQLRQEFESLLVAAERLQESCDRLQGRIELANMAGSFLFSGLLFLSLYIGLKFGWAVGVSGVVVSVLIFGSYQRLSQLSTKRRLERDRRALDALTQLLRETETAFLLQGVMGTLEIAQFKIRMARFDLRSN